MQYNMSQLNPNPYTNIFHFYVSYWYTVTCAQNFPNVLFLEGLPATIADLHLTFPTRATCLTHHLIYLNSRMF
jgi:hypothetical protein